MDIQQIRYFIVLAEYKSFAKAAEQLYISRQGLSKSIMILEKEFNVPLFLRTSTGIELTENGKTFYAHALRLVDEYDSALRNIQKPNAAQGSHIQFILPNGFWKNVHMDMLDGFFDQHPEITFSSFHYSDNMVLNMFLQGNFDFAITSDPHKNDKLQYHPLFRNYRCVSVGKDHPLAQKAYIQTIDLKDYLIAAVAGGSFDSVWLQHICNDVGFAPQLKKIQDGLTAFQYVENGRLPSLLVGNICESNDGIMYSRYLFWNEDELEKTAIDFSIVTIKGKPLSPIIKSLIQYAQDYCQTQLSNNNHYPYNIVTDFSS